MCLIIWEEGKVIKIDFVTYTEDFLNLSWVWLNDPEIKALTLTPDFSKEEQVDFYKKLPLRVDYKISGIMVNAERAGACGLKNIKNDEAEFWCYLGLKKYWGAGLGHSIVQYVEFESKKLNISNLYLKVGKSNIRAIKTYEKNGFNVAIDHSEYFVMTKSIL
jgi:RimJ/RimL family protein N-acetyltransferase